MQNYLLYQAYGSISLINECKFSLLRLINVYKEGGILPPPVIIYTDQAPTFSTFTTRLNLEIVSITDVQLKKWRGDIDFVHRVKIEIINDCFHRFSGTILYVDTDTYALRSLEDVFASIDPSTVFFHKYEGNIITTSEFKKWRKFLKKFKDPLFDGFSPLTTDMWNAGVIGLDYSHQFYLADILKITDRIYGTFKKHIAEQFSFCYVLQREGVSFKAAEPFIFHYWDLKEFRILLNHFFAKYEHRGIDELLERSISLHPEKIIREKKFYEESSFVKKWLLKTSGKAWNIKSYPV